MVPFFFRIASLETYSTEGCHSRTGRTCPWKLCNSSRTAVGDLGCWKVYSSRWEVASQDFFARSLRCNQTLCEKNLSQNITQYDQFAYISSHFGRFYPIFRRQRCMKPSMLQRHSKGTIPSYYPKRTN